MNNPQLQQSGLDITTLSFEDALAALRKALAARYPSCGMTYFAYSLDGPNRISTFGHFGNQTELECAGTDIVLRDKVATNFIDDVFLNRILSISSSRYISSPALKQMHDYALDYAKEIGIDTNGLGYWCKREPAATVPKSSALVQTDTEAIASRIKMLQDEIKSLQRNLDPNVKVATLRALAKRLRRAGDITAANATDAEANQILDRIKRKAEIKQIRIENLRLARQAKVAIRKKREQQQLDRQRGQQQFNPHKAAKAKMQKIRERQAERKASKKKASESKEWTNRPISQVIASRAI